MGFRADVFLMSRSSTGPVPELLFHDPSVKGHIGFFLWECNGVRLRREKGKKKITSLIMNKSWRGLLDIIQKKLL